MNLREREVNRDVGSGGGRWSDIYGVVMIAWA